MTTRLLPSLSLALRCGLASAALLDLVGCGEQEIRALERLPSASLERGRVQVRSGDLFTDKGTRLRGATVGLDTSPSTLLEPALFDELSHQSGLNAFHVYLENNEDVTGVNAANADRLVELTAQSGMYLLIGLGGGHLRDAFDLEKVRSFWDFYAPRYAARSHVLYEVQNQPEYACDAPLRDETLSMEREAYGRIRAAAPDSHVVLFSYHAIPTAAALGSALDSMAGVVDWSNASVAFHGGEDCVDSRDLFEVLAVSRARGVAAFASEVPSGAPASETGDYEAARAGWFNFRWIVQDRDLGAFRSEHDAAGVSWCPDFGVWPQDAERCTSP